AHVELVVLEEFHKLSGTAVGELIVAVAPEQAIQVRGIGRADEIDRLTNSGGFFGAASESLAERFEFTLPVGVLIGVVELLEDGLELAESCEATGDEGPDFDAAILHGFLQRENERPFVVEHLL